MESSSIRLYNLMEDGWKELSRGEEFRADAIYRCHICLTWTNLVRVGGFFVKKPLIECRGSSFKEHENIENLTYELIDIQSEIIIYDKEQKHPYLDQLRAVKAERESELAEIRMMFMARLSPDVEGLTKDSTVVDFYPHSRNNGHRPSIATFADNIDQIMAQSDKRANRC